jgi:hypothetical protein
MALDAILMEISHALFKENMVWLKNYGVLLNKY